MKPLLLFAALLFAAAVQAQQVTPHLPRLQERAMKFKMSERDLQQANSELVITQTELPIAQKVTQVIALPQDNMPCIVPETKAIAVMPNALVTLRQPVTGQIPNAWGEAKSLKSIITAK